MDPYSSWIKIGNLRYWKLTPRRIKELREVYRYLDRMVMENLQLKAEVASLRQSNLQLQHMLGAYKKG